MASTPMRLVVLLAVAALWPALSEPEAAGVADVTGATPEASPQEAAVAEGATAADPPSAAASIEEAASEDAAAAAAVANATEQARMDLMAVNASLVASANLRGSSGWGHGVSGETCCMCSQSLGWTTVLYAAEDYSYGDGVHSAYWGCLQECEDKCLSKGGHMFGCYDEQHLVIMDSLYSYRSDYNILHDDHYGDIC